MSQEEKYTKENTSDTFRIFEAEFITLWKYIPHLLFYAYFMRLEYMFYITEYDVLVKCLDGAECSLGEAKQDATTPVIVQET